ncbi:E3 ubiquitin-protein ligase TRIM21-like [Cheilinus undulatus]|uniref:E3 ubiquitin-protein ligase TRIM21-like n=1 Tax=Cheilinus undulatus TaxID=241271 RepID=UPI001BD3FCAA|nr:E3 ubiquitin-protein ligase TRIM21-like [Cheilinus undulatus]
MSAASFVLTEDQFLCSICLDVFSDPVSTPCGHNFCQSCITEHWDVNAPYCCPICKEVFRSRPELKVNTFIKEMAAQFRQSAHLEPHLTTKIHQLIDPVESLESRMCEKHNKELKLFCRNDQRRVCMMCTVLDHKTHDVVPLKDEYGGKKSKIHQMIQKKRLKMEELKCSVELNDKNADREIAEAVQVFSALIETVQRNLNRLIDSIKEKQEKTKNQAEGFIREMEQEISELEKRSTEEDQPSRPEDPLQLLNAALRNKAWTEVRVHPPSYEGTVRRALNQLEETISQQMKKPICEVGLKKVQQYEVDVTLDPDTAHPKLILSDDGKQVKHSDIKKNLPQSQKRFDFYSCVLAKQSFSAGRFYYEVQVKGKTKWDLGVARRSVKRKEDITLSPRNGFWVICLRNKNEYKAGASPPDRLSLQSGPEKVGVFVDYEEGLISFYDVDAAALIYSFTGCSFTEELCPYFSPCINDGGENSAPLIISAVSQTKEIRYPF